MCLIEDLEGKKNTRQGRHYATMVGGMCADLGAATTVMSNYKHVAFAGDTQLLLSKNLLLCPTMSAREGNKTGAIIV